jgi:PPM family protein phosphatase
MISYEIGSASLIGGRSENQDRWRIAETNCGLLAVVCDGMGGMNGGSIAAELAVSKIFEFVLPAKENSQEVVKAAILKANSAIFREGSSNPDLFRMGTTVTALLINEHHALSFHVGDSRIYQIREGRILYRTFDHSKVFEYVRLGILTEEQARVSPESNIITRALGSSPFIEITVSEGLAYKSGDRFLLCTDGVWGALPEAELILRVSVEKPANEVVM